jgi:endogenous inhibitor of DNA gyrase (YacG/DUF329 family)
MKSPICKKEVRPGDPEMPFCSERCRLIDLGKWANEEYRIPVSNSQPPPPAAEETEEQDE